MVHGVKVLKSEVEMNKEQDRQLVSRMDSVKTASDQLREDVETVRKIAISTMANICKPLLFALHGGLAS